MSWNFVYRMALAIVVVPLGCGKTEAPPEAKSEPVKTAAPSKAAPPAAA